jgi:hypothetical protein
VTAYPRYLEEGSQPYDPLVLLRLTEWAAEVLFRIFNARYVARAHTLVVSNVRPEDLAVSSCVPASWTSPCAERCPTAATTIASARIGQG